jgi:hypothetical protein
LLRRNKAAVLMNPERAHAPAEVLPAGFAGLVLRRRRGQVACICRDISVGSIRMIETLRLASLTGSLPMT